jgi:hypothetical protein
VVVRRLHEGSCVVLFGASLRSMREQHGQSRAQQTRDLSHPLGGPRPMVVARRRAGVISPAHGAGLSQGMRTRLRSVRRACWRQDRSCAILGRSGDGLLFLSKLTELLTLLFSVDTIRVTQSTTGGVAMGSTTEGTWISQSEAARRLGVSRAVVRELVRDQYLTTRRLPAGSTRVLASDVDELGKRHTVAAARG